MPGESRTAWPHEPTGIVSWGAVPVMNHSSTVFAPGWGLRTVKASIFARTRPSGRENSLTDQAFGASWGKPCQTYDVTSIENTGLPGVDTTVLSLLPFQAPTRRANAPFYRPAVVGAAIKQY